MYHPWRDLRDRWPGVHVDCRRRLRGLLGIVTSDGSIHLDGRQSQRQRRCTLAHEIVHLDRGDTGAASPWHERRQEATVHAEAARRLITVERLVDALLWSQDEHELAAELWVDVPTVRTRLETLTDAERAHIDTRLWEREVGA